MMAHVPRSQRAIETLSKVDPQFRDFIETIYGADLDPVEIWKDAFGPVRKDNPTQSDLNTGNAKRRLAIAGTLIGAGLGGRELVQGAGQMIRGGGEALKPGLLTRTGNRIAPKATAAVQNNPRAVGALRTAGAGTMLAADLSAVDELRKPKQVASKSVPWPPRRQRVRKVGPSSINDLVDGITRGKLVLHEANPVGQGILARIGPKTEQGAADAKAGFAASRAPGTPAAPAAPGAAGAASHPAPAAAPAAPAASAAPGTAPAATPAPAAGGSAAPAAPAAPGAPATPGVNQASGSYQSGQAAGHAANALLTPTGKKVMAVGGAAALAHHVMGGGDQQPLGVDQFGQPVYKSHPRRAKASDIVWHGEISKVDEDKHLAFGYASVVSIGGVPVLDRQGDVISQEEIEKAAYDYVQRSRKGGDMHRRTTDAFGNDTPHHVSDLVESFVITDEKVAKMGLPHETPRGWWVGFKVHDDDTWQLVKKRERTGFSIHGVGRRVPVDMDELMGYVA